MAMTTRKRFAVLTVLGVLAAAGAGGIALQSMYRVALGREGEALRQVVAGQASMAEAEFVRALAAPGGEGDTAQAVSAVVDAIRAAQATFRGFGPTGELTAARIGGDTLIFLLGVGWDSALVPERILLPSRSAEASQRAARGGSGLIRGRGRLGNEVLAAFAPVAGSGVGLVAEIDMAAIRAPYVRAAWGTGGVIAVVLATVLILGLVVGRPLLAEVEERERAHRALLEHFPGIICRAVPEPTDGWRFEVFEGAVEELCGYPAHSFLGPVRAWLALVPEEEHAPLRERGSQLAAGTVRESAFEHRLRRKDGSFAWVRAVAWSEPGPAEERAIVGVIYDITAERRAREIRLRAEQELRALVRHLPGVAVHILDRDFRCLYSGGEVLERLGLSHEALEGRHVSDLLGPERAGFVLEEGAHVLQGETRRFEGKFGGLRFAVTAAPLGAPSGDVERILVLALDVTEARGRERALAESEQRLRLALKVGGHGFYDVDLRTGAAVVNEEYARMLGHDPASFVESVDGWKGRLHPEDRDAAIAEYEAYLAGEREHYRQEFRLQTASGEWKWILSMGEIVERDSGGCPTRLLGTHTDIDARKKGEEALRAHLEELRRWQAVTLDREDRVAELKREINELCRRVGEAPRYPSQESESGA